MTEGTSLLTSTRVLWVGCADIPASLTAAAGSRWELAAADAARPLAEQLAQATLAVVAAEEYEQDPARLIGLLDELARSPAVAVFIVPQDATTCLDVLERRGGQFLCVSADATAEQLSAKLSAAAELQPAIMSLRAELAAHREAYANYDSDDLEEIDQQLQLASRLQHDFLPQRLPEVASIRFAALYHPAGWVSGDIYDVTRLDEQHVGFYVADVVGHGMPAALLTMFIKKALQTKRISGHSYEIIPPSASLAELNGDICSQDLAGCQFCSAIYAVVDTASMTLTFARAGHPEPILIRADKPGEVLSCQGSLLGVFEEAQYPSRTVQLTDGDRLILYTDGLEGIFGRSPEGRPPDLRKIFSAWAGLSRQEVMFRITERIQSAPPHVQRADDVTVLIMDVGRE